MRTIKFRGKRSDTKEWVYGFYGLSLDDKHYIIEATFDHSGDRCYFFDTEVIPETVGQFTGLTDKNGKEIYEGDIVSFDGNMTADDTMGFEPNGFIYDENSIHCVVWGDEYACWEVDFQNDEHWKYKRDTRHLLITNSCKVIGNIHDNPELLHE